MIARTKTQSVKAPLVTALTVLVTLLAAGQAGAVYLRDGAVGNDPLSYDNPKDGMCVVGIRDNLGVAEFLIDKNITNARDCAAYTSNLTGLTSSALCQPAAVGATLPASSTGWRHAWSTSVCRDAGLNGISRVDLDNTAAMCTAKGGTIGAACVAYGWLYRGATSGTVPSIPDGPDPAAPFNASNYEIWTGVDYASGHGFCYREMDFTNAPSDGFGYTIPTDTTWDGNECPMFAADNATGRSMTGTTWSDFSGTGTLPRARFPRRAARNAGTPMASRVCSCPGSPRQ